MEARQTASPHHQTWGEGVCIRAKAKLQAWNCVNCLKLSLKVLFKVEEKCING